MKLSKSHWFSIQQLAIVGTPDILGVVNGVFIALELKASAKAKASEAQLYNLGKVIAAGGIGLIVHPENWSQVLELLIFLSERQHAINLWTTQGTPVSSGLPQALDLLKIGKWGGGI